MTTKSLFIDTCIILAIFSIGWGVGTMTKRNSELNTMVQAIPIIRFERFDPERNALIIGLFNPGTASMEISRTALFYETKNKITSANVVSKEYRDKPLVLDPGDTILVPLMKSSDTEMGSYWGELNFRIPGQVDFYSVHHQFSQQLSTQNKEYR